MSEPLARFREVFDQARATGMVDPNAMTVASVGAGARPSSRTVLLKAFDERGFVFFTNYESRKGREVLAHPYVALLFFWRDLGKQVRIEGRATPVADEEADAYFATRARRSQLGAWASRQSRRLEDRAQLRAALEEAARRFPDRVPRPPHWSGFRVTPVYFEFWDAGEFRLHQRTVFERTEGGWRSYELFP